VATHQDLLDAINRVRGATGDRQAWRSGLSGDDIAVACSVFSSPAALGDVLAKIIAAHPDAFVPRSGPSVNTGVAADAIRDAETALAQQNSTAAQVDLQVLNAILNAHAANAEGAAELGRLQREIEQAVLSRTDLDTPAGAREFQRFLIGKLRDIRAVVDTAGLDASSKAALAVALAALYASTSAEPAPPAPSPEVDRPDAASGERDHAGSEPARAGEELPVPMSAQLGDLSPWDLGDLPPEPMTAPMADPMPAPVMPTSTMAAPPPAPAAPAWGGGLPAGSPFGGGGLSAPLPEPARLPAFPDPDFESEPDESRRDAGSEQPEPEAEAAPELEAEAAPEPTEDPTAVELPDGQTLNAPTPELAAAISAAVAGMPIAEAFRQQGITLPPPGSPVTAPIDASRLLPGDIGMLTDRHAVALGNGKALLDNRIQPIANVTGLGFLGWQQPPSPVPITTTTSDTPEIPAPTRPAETAPSEQE
jgi:hypothetical protein